MTTTIKKFSKMLFAFVLCAGLVMTSCETADPENTGNTGNTGNNNSTSNIIVFADDIVKKSCVEVFDTDGDGEVSYDEAAAVKDLSNVTLRFIDDFLTFDEFQYFINVKSLPDKFFEGGKCLKSIVFPEGLETIGERAFQECTSLKSIVFPEGLETIGKSAFRECTSLESIVFPEGLETIGERAFQECTSLAEVELPRGLETTGECAFIFCTNLKKIKFSLGLLEVGDQAFDYCKNITEVHFPDGLEWIGYNAFADSYPERVYCACTTPPEVHWDGILYGKTLYVPKNSVELYTAADYYWRFERILGYDF